MTGNMWKLRRKKYPKYTFLTFLMKEAIKKFFRQNLVT